ncbi:CCR4-NOT transcription complex subunit 6-like [Clavelina lepadiformis]|uniref:poly(A)-specific ribonuclease n=1 Tax=Clavelina lepadiformis TaxID=159417 RepID=A0ABP0FH85_CLALP
MQLKPMPKDETKHRHGRRKTHIMSQEEAKSGKESHWEELEITGTIRNLSPALWQLTHLTVLFLNDNQLTRIPPDVSRLQNLHCLDLSSNKLRSLPAELGDLIELRELMLNHNSLRVLPYELGKLFQLQLLGLNGNPLQPDIQNLYKTGPCRLLTYLLDNLAVTTPEPPEREWVHASDPERTQPMAIFSVMSYNVLCDKYATRQLYGYCPPWALNWEYRRKTIMREILYYSADIVALQEVETCEYHSLFVPEMKLNGYEGIFNPKSRAKHMGEDDKQHVDGCAIFWKVSKFTLVKEYLVEFNQVAMQNNEGSEDMLNRVMTKDNIGIAALLETNDGLYENAGFRSAGDHSKQLVLAANAHMHWDPEFSDVKLIQTVMLCHELKRICDEASQSFRPGGRTSAGPSECHKMPLVLCGDFNSLPDSGVTEFLQRGKVSSTHQDFKEIKYSKCLSAFGNGLRTNGTIQFDPKSITHPFRLNSCYNESNYHLLQYSNHTYDFKGIIDYIFYSRTQLKCLGVLGGIDRHWFKINNIVGCPHPHVPSDHIPVVTEFQLLPQGFQQTPNNHPLLSQNGNLYNNHPHPYSLFTQPSSFPPSTSSSLSSNGFQPPQQQNRFPAVGRPGSANSLNNSPINIPNGTGGSMPHMGGMGMLGGMGLNGRR